MYRPGSRQAVGRRALAPAQQLGTVAQRHWAASPLRYAVGWELSPAEELPVERTPSCRDRELARVEAVLFLARSPLSSRKLAQMAGLPDGTRARALVRRLQRCYQEQGTAFQVVEVGGGFQLRTRAELAAWTTPLVEEEAVGHLSAPAMETLAVVAYNQPVLRAQVEAIRGVQCGELLKQLLQRGLVRIVGRSRELGRPFLYGTTRRFLEVFGLRSLDDLPQFDMIRQTQETESEQLTTVVQPQEPAEVRTTLLPPNRSTWTGVPAPDHAEEPPLGPAPQPQAQDNGDDWEEEDDEDWEDDWDEEDEDWDEDMDEEWEEVDDEDWDEDEEDWGDEDWEEDDWEDEEEDYLDLE